MQECRAARMHGCRAAWVQRYKDAGIHGCRATRMQGCMSAEIQGYRDAGLQGCKGAGLQRCKGAGLCASLRLLTDICAVPAFTSEECCYYGHWWITLGDTCCHVSLANNKSGNDSYCTIMPNVFKILQWSPGPHTQKIGDLLPRLGSPDSKLVILLCQMATFLLNEIREEMVMLAGGTICNPSYFTDKSRKT